MAAVEFLIDGGDPAFCAPREQTCCFTGHRSIPLDCYDRLKEETILRVKELIARGYTHFIVGGALGFDTLAARIILLMKESRPELCLTVAIPCPNQADGWSAESRARYQKIIEHADRAILLSHGYHRGCMMKRNRFMVDNSSACIAFLAKESGGTVYTANYAKKCGVELICVLSS